MTPAVDKAFGTAEILENILFQADEQTMIRAKAISKKFKATIEDSPKIQKVLCYKAETEVAACEYENGVLVPEVYLNLLLDDLRSVSYDEGACAIGPGIHYRCIDEHVGSRKVPKDASCRNMLILQPPVNTLELSINYCYAPNLLEKIGQKWGPKPGWYLFEKTIQNDEGVRFGDVLKVLEEMGVDGTVSIEAAVVLYREGAKRTKYGGWEHRDRPVKQDVKVDVKNPKLVMSEVKMRATQDYHYEMMTEKGRICRPIEKFNPDSDGSVVKKYKMTS